MLADDYLPIAIFALIALLFPIIVFLMSRYFRPRISPLGTSSSLLGKHFRDAVTEKEKAVTYECGEDPEGEAHIQFHFQYYMYAIIFLLFDVVTVFLLLWALRFSDLSKSSMVFMFCFMAIMLVCLMYALKKEEAIYI